MRGSPKKTEISVWLADKYPSEKHAVLTGVFTSSEVLNIPSRICRSLTSNFPSVSRRSSSPETVKEFSRFAFVFAKNVIFEAHPDNPYLTVEDNKIVRKNAESICFVTQKGQGICILCPLFLTNGAECDTI